MRRIVLHIGTHKTGSTSIQSFLTYNFEHLRSKGVLFPLSGRFDDSNHAPLAWELRAFAELGRYNLTQMIDWQETISEIKHSSAETVVISSEEFCLLPQSAIDLLSQLFLDQGMRLEVVVFLRDQLSVLLSYYIELLKQGEADIDFSGFVSKSYFMMGYAFNLIQFDYLLLLKKWESHRHVTLTAVEYLPQENAVVKFVDILGLKHQDFEVNSIDIKLNRAPNAMSFAALLYANKFMSLCQNLSPSRKRQIAYDILQKALKKYAEGPQLNVFDDDVVRIVKDYYLASNKWLAKKYGINFIKAFDRNKEKTQGSIKIELPLSDLEYWHYVIRNDLEFSLDLVK